MGASAPPALQRDVSLDYALWPMPDALPGAKVPPSYTIDTETVTDDVTHLVWQRNVPAVYSGCSGGRPSKPGEACKWTDADKYCRSTALSVVLGGEGWRLPRKIELESILDETRRRPAINIQAFPDAPEDSFWTATLYSGTSDYFWYVSFSDGADNANQIIDSFRVRCVRSTMQTTPNVLADRYDIEDSVVKDRMTGLSWQRDADAEKRNWNDARAHCSRLTLAGGGWRLPAYKEMLTLFDPAQLDPAIDTRAFPRATAEEYWTASPRLDSAGGYRSVDFGHDGTVPGAENDPHLVRCVR